MKDNAIGLVNAKHGDFMFYNYDEFVGMSIREYGEWSEKLLQKILSLINESDYVIDIGSHIGLMTIPIAKKVGAKGLVYSFEPQKMLYNLQCGNLALNNIKNVETFNTAMGKFSGEIFLNDIDYSEIGNFGGFGIKKDYDYSKFIKTTNKKKMKVDIKNLDQFLTLTKCNLIKLEAELLETEILRGGLKFIKKFRPLIVAENNPKDPCELNEYLLTQNYKLYWFDYRFFNENNYFINSNNYFKKSGKFYIFAFPKEMKIKTDDMVEILKPEQKNLNYRGNIKNQN